MSLALYAFDGTWNEHEDEPSSSTNVVRFKNLYNGRTEYLKGVRTKFGAPGKILGGLFGVGGRTRIDDMGDALSKNLAAGDDTVDIIGFSRGAALAVHFANVLAEYGVELPNGDVMRPEIRFLGLWDIVASFGLSFDFIINFQDINLGWNVDTVPDSVRVCRHAMALDERREAFNITRLTNASQTNIDECWFRGVHTDIGGGNGNVGRNNIALHWMLENARLADVPIAVGDIAMILDACDPSAPISENKDAQVDDRRTVNANDTIHPTAESAELTVGDKRTFTVRAADKFNWSGVKVTAGGRYRFNVPTGQVWHDDSIECGPDGWRTENELAGSKQKVVEAVESKRRHPDGNWFEIIAAIGDEDDNLFRIGAGGEGREFVAPMDNDLYAFANDLSLKYDNNTGEMIVEVERVA